MARAPKSPEPGRRKKAGGERTSADASRPRSPFPPPPAAPRTPAARSTSVRPPARTAAPPAPPSRRPRTSQSARTQGAGRAETAIPAAAAPAAVGPERPGPAARIARGLGLLADLARVNLSGWGGVLRNGLRVALGGFARVNLVQLLFTAACLAVFVTALARWLQYDITLLSLETVASGSRSRFWFLLPALLGLLFVSVDLPFRRLIFYISAAAAGALYGAGFAFPDPIHTKMLKYEFTPWIYAYGAALAAAASLAGGGLSRALIEKEAIRNFLFSRPAD